MRLALLALATVVVLLSLPGSLWADQTDTFQKDVPTKGVLEDSPFGRLTFTDYYNIQNAVYSKANPFSAGMADVVNSIIGAIASSQPNPPADLNKFAEGVVDKFTKDRIFGLGVTANFLSATNSQGGPRAFDPQFVQLAYSEVRAQNSLGIDESGSTAAQETTFAKVVGTKQKPYGAAWVVDGIFKNPLPDSPAYTNVADPYVQFFDTINNNHCRMWDRPAADLDDVEAKVAAGAIEDFEWDFQTWVTSGWRSSRPHKPLGHLDWTFVVRVTVGPKGANSTRAELTGVPNLSDTAWKNLGDDPGADAAFATLVRTYFPNY